MFEPKPSDLTKQKCTVLRGPSSTRPMIWLVEDKDSKAVVKDFSSNSAIFRNIVGRFLIWREKRAYKALRGLKGVPQFYGASGLAIVTQQIPGKNMEQLESDDMIPPGFFEALTDLIKRFHGRGIAHCDLKRAPNIILGDDGTPYVVDWAASISKREFQFFSLDFIYRRFLADDFTAIIKLKLRHDPESVTPEEKARYYSRSRAELVIRSIRDRLRALLQRIA